MKRIFLFLSILLFSCTAGRQAGNLQTGLHNMEHYYLKNTVTLHNSYNGIVVRDDKSFKMLFYCDEISQNSIIRPDFSNHLVVALALDAMDNSRLRFTHAEMKNEHLNVYGKKERIMQETESPVAIALLPKYSVVQQINFFIDDSLVATASLETKNGHNIFADAGRKFEKAIAGKLRRKIVIVPAKLYFNRSC